VTGHFPSAEIVLGKSSDGNKQWHHIHNFPEIGLTFFYSSLANNKYMGNVFAIYPHINFSIIRKDNFLFTFRMGSGLGYITKSFERTENYKNIAIGSHLNAAINACFETYFRISKKISLNAGFGFTHFSNAAFKMPNLGINVPTVSAGVYYKFKESIVLPNKTDLSFSKKIQYQISLTGGLKELYPEGGSKFGTYSVSFCTLKPLNIKTSAGIGFDLFYDTSILQILKNDNNPVAHNYEILKPALCASYEILISKVSIYLQVGGYIYKISGNKLLYEKLSWRYYFSEHMFASIALKAHFPVADDFDFGIGYKF